MRWSESSVFARPVSIYYAFLDEPHLPRPIGRTQLAVDRRTALFLVTHGIMMAITALRDLHH
jgi:hypothetical protein